MSGPQESDPTRHRSLGPKQPPDFDDGETVPASMPPRVPQQPQREEDHTPWWQQVRRHARSQRPAYPAPPPSFPARPPQQPAANYHPSGQPYPGHPAQTPRQPSGSPHYAQPSDADQRKQARKRIWIGCGIGAALALVIAVVVGLWMGGSFSGNELDVRQAQADIEQILTDPVSGYGVEDVSGIMCNDGENPTVKKGESFLCEVTVDGEQRRVNVVFADDNGTYAVDRPR